MIPSEIKVHKKSATLELIYKDVSHTLSAEYLRVYSPSAEVRGHSPEQAVLQHGKRHVTFKEIEPQGNYAIRLIFSDGHDSGIYSWSYLRELGDNFDPNWADYLTRLEEAGKSREPQFIAVST
ncbi:MAG: DUF971 domain-containing protein [Proteobacteria bacterium]|nr:DUF971 domain-containing protein [Pseudomonadota bacterium]